MDSNVLSVYELNAIRSQRTQRNCLFYGNLEEVAGEDGQYRLLMAICKMNIDGCPVMNKWDILKHVFGNRSFRKDQWL